MAKGGGSQTVSQTESAPAQKVTTSLMDHYMPGGKMVDKPQFDLGKNRWMGEQRVAGFTPDHNAAFDATRATAFEHRPAMETSARMAVAGAGPTGQKIGLGNNWSTNQDGSAQFRDWDSGTANDYMNPFTENVIGSGVRDLAEQRNITQMGIGDAAEQADAFGGSRHGIQSGTADTGFMKTVGDFVGSMRADSYDKARGEYGQDYARGAGAIGYNKGVDDDNATRLAAGSDRLSSLAKQNADLNKQGIEGLNSVGNIIQGQEQTIRDTSYDELMNEFLFPAQLGGMIKGQLPGPSQTQKSGGGGSIWGSVGSAALSAAIPMLLSDETAKENVEEVDPEDSLAAIRKLRPVKYDYTPDAIDNFGAPSGRRTGFMAQDLEAATGKKAPAYGDSGYKGVDVLDHLGRLTHALQAVDRKIEAITTKKKVA